MKQLNGFKRTGLLLSVLFIFHAAHSQENFIPGYVIQNNNDTLFGWVDYRNWKKNPDWVSFKTKDGSDPIVYTTTEIKEFGVEEDIYVSAVVEAEVSPLHINKLNYIPDLTIVSDTTFLQVLFKGEKSLYVYKNKDGRENYYIKKASGYELLIYNRYFVLLNKHFEIGKRKRVIAENKKYLNQLALYLGDCKSIQSLLQSTTYDQKRLIKLFQDYYECTSSCLYFQKKPDRIRIETGILAGTSVTTLDFRSENHEFLVNAAYSPSVNFSSGLFFNLIFPRNQGKWSVYNELLYTSFRVEDVFEDFKHEDLYTITTTELGYSYLKLNNMIRFRYPTGSFLLFLNGGITNGFAVSETNYKRAESKYYNEDRIKEGRALDDTRKYEQGYLIGTGAKYNRLSVEFRYEKGSGMSEYLNLKSAVNRYYLLVGYRF